MENGATILPPSAEDQKQWRHLMDRDTSTFWLLRTNVQHMFVVMQEKGDTWEDCHGRIRQCHEGKEFIKNYGDRMLIVLVDLLFHHPEQCHWSRHFLPYAHNLTLKEMDQAAARIYFHRHHCATCSAYLQSDEGVLQKQDRDGIAWYLCRSCCFSIIS